MADYYDNRQRLLELVDATRTRAVRESQEVQQQVARPFESYRWSCSSFDGIVVQRTTANNLQEQERRVLHENFVSLFEERRNRIAALMEAVCELRVVMPRLKKPGCD